MYNNWNLVRIVRLLLGVTLVVMGIQEQSWFFMAAGGLFTLMPLLNVGCCSTATAAKRNTSTEEDRPIVYEEIR